jgi:hypothetical protein
LWVYQDKQLVVTLCLLVLSLVSGAATSNIYDGQLRAWGVHPEGFKALRRGIPMRAAPLAAATVTVDPDYLTPSLLEEVIAVLVLIE